MVARTKKRIGIIGGGLGGLASACTLAARGHEVTLFDKNDWIGGKAAVLEGNGFRFDMGRQSSRCLQFSNASSAKLATSSKTASILFDSTPNGAAFIRTAHTST